MKIHKILFLLASLFPVICQGESAVTIHNGFITGNIFRALEPASKNVYATGLIDGILLAPFYGAPESNLDGFEACTTDMTGQQIVAIFEKYLRENPERWHQSMHVLGYLAIKKACEK